MSDADALDRMFNASSVAVIGASSEAGKVGHSVVKNLVDGGFRGRVYPVNPARAGDELLGCPYYASLADIPGTVEGNPVFTYHDAFNRNLAEVDDLKTRYRAGKVGDVEVKRKLADALNLVLEPIRERRAAVLAKPERLKEMLFDGSARARTVAADTMGRVRDAMKITYR